MKITFRPLVAIILICSTFFMNYKLAQVGVPDEIILLMSLAFVLLFPWKTFVLESESKENTTSEGKKDENN